MSSAGGVLASYVTLRDEQFRLVTFAAGDTPPAWAQARITNPKAWRTAPTVEPSAAPEAEPTQEPSQTPSPEPEPPVAAEATEAEDEDLLGALPEPPKRGAGSGRDAWAAYAQSKGIAVTDDMTRDEIIDALDA